MHPADLEDLWPAPEPNLILAPRDVHLWGVGLIQPQNIYERCRLCLSREELERGDRFHFARDRDRFVISHAAVRQILAFLSALYRRAAPICTAEIRKASTCAGF